MTILYDFQDLLKELEEFAFKGIPDMRACSLPATDVHNDDNDDENVCYIIIVHNPYYSRSCVHLTSTYLSYTYFKIHPPLIMIISNIPSSEVKIARDERSQW